MNNERRFSKEFADAIFLFENNNGHLPDTAIMSEHKYTCLMTPRQKKKYKFGNKTTKRITIGLGYCSVNIVIDDTVGSFLLSRKG